MLSPLLQHKATEMRSIAFAKQWKLFSCAKKTYHAVTVRYFQLARNGARRMQLSDSEIPALAANETVKQ